MRPRSSNASSSFFARCTAIIGRRRRDRHGKPKPKGPRVPRWLGRIMGQESSSLVDESVPPQTLAARTLSAVAEYIKDGKAKRIVVLTGAGISTAAGIPDFRSPGTGLYANLARLNLPHAEAVFDISYFRQNPEPFYVLARELYPGKFHPTVSHAFITLLARRGFLSHLFTQNIDCLERRAGVPADKIVEAHGSFATQRCIDCRREYPDGPMREHVERGQVPRCEDETCGGLVKPDIVFFGEQLPSDFERSLHHLSMADLVLVIGTSLTVFPFAKLPDLTLDGKPRVLFNLERVGTMGTQADDVLELGDCDSGIRKLADELGWREELEELWTGIVGEEEATRQKVTRKQHEDEVEEEVKLLAQEVEAVLNIEETPRRDPDTDGKNIDEQTADTKVDEIKAETKEDDNETNANQKPDPDKARPSETEATPTATAATPEHVTNTESKAKDTVPTSSVEPTPETRPAEDEAGAGIDTKETKDAEKSVL